MTTTWKCRRCWTPITSGLMCAGCVQDSEDIVAARHTPNYPGAGHDADLAARDLFTHREWLRTGHIPASAKM